MTTLNEAVKNMPYEILWNYCPDQEIRELGFVQGAVISLTSGTSDFVIVRLKGRHLVLDSEAAQYIKIGECHGAA